MGLGALHRRHAQLGVAAEKFVAPNHATAIFAYFYGVADVSAGVAYVLGVLELELIVAPVAGLWRRISYAGVALIHSATTFAAFPYYLEPCDNMLFFAAWPMLAACVAPQLLREQHTLAAVASGDTAAPTSVY